MRLVKVRIVANTRKVMKASASVTRRSIVSKDNIMQMYVVEAQTELDKWEPITIHVTLLEAIDDYNLFKGEMPLRITTYTRTGFVNASTKTVSTECN